MSKNIKRIIQAYKDIILGVDSAAAASQDRAYGGVLRASKGKLQEHITEEIVKLAWSELRADKSRLSINAQKQKISIRESYIARLKADAVRQYITEHQSEYLYKLSVDKQIFVDGKFVMAIECKAYAENAMLKRILVDFSLLKTIHPNISCYLFQLESQLGGDYSEMRDDSLGSKPSHTLMSYFPDVDLNIITLLKGERQVDKPIHKFFKPLEEKRVKKAISILKEDLRQYL